MQFLCSTVDTHKYIFWPARQLLFFQNKKNITFITQKQYNKSVRAEGPTMITFLSTLNMRAAHCPTSTLDFYITKSHIPEDTNLLRNEI